MFCSSPPLVIIVVGGVVCGAAVVLLVLPFPVACFLCPLLVLLCLRCPPPFCVRLLPPVVPFSALVCLGPLSCARVCARLSRPVLSALRPRPPLLSVAFVPRCRVSVVLLSLRLLVSSRPCRRVLLLVVLVALVAPLRLFLVVVVARVPLLFPTPMEYYYLPSAPWFYETMVMMWILLCNATL